MTLTELARAYYSEGSRGHPVCQRQKERLFLNDLRFGNGRFKPLKSLLKRMGWREERPLNRRQLALIIQLFFSLFASFSPLRRKIAQKVCIFVAQKGW